MDNLIRNGDRRRGFTLVELLIVMAIISVLVGIAIPMYQKSIRRTKEAVLQQNLFLIRQMIDEYTVDKAKAPVTLEDLVKEGYLRKVPIDPMTGNSESWQIQMEDAMSSASQSEPGIFDVRSGSGDKGLNGVSYSEW
jgi:general secretion pathway protein G